MEDHPSQGSDELKSPLNNNLSDDRFHRNQGTILFVGNLPFLTPWQHVKDHFRNAGKVRYTDLIADRNGRPKGSALVTMMTPDGAQNAIRMFNETDFEGRRLIVRKFDDGPRPTLVQRDMMPQYHANNRRNQFVPTSGGSSAYYANPAVGAGAPGGSMNVSGGPYARGYGSCQGAPYQAVDTEAALGGVPMIDLAGDQVPKPRSQQVPEVGRKLFVSNLPFDCTSYALRETFQQVGNVERAEIILGRTGKSRGMGIVVMKTEEEARVAIAEFDGIEMANRAMNVRLDKNAQ